MSGGTSYPLSDIYESVKTPNQDIISFRQLPNETEAEQGFRDSEKEKFAGLTGSGVFNGRRAAKEITEHSGRIVIDLDKKGLKGRIQIPNRIELLSLKRRLIEDEYVEAVYESISATGLAVYIKINPNDHTASFQGLKKYFKERYGMDIDPKCSDPSRFRFVSYDPDIYVNWGSKVFYPTRAYVDHIKRVTQNIVVAAERGTVHDALMRSSRLMGGYIAGELIAEDEGFNWLVELMRAKPNVVSIEAEKKKIRDGICNGKEEPITGDMAFKNDRENEEERKRWREVYAWIHTLNKAGREWTEADVDAMHAQHCVDRDKVKYAFKNIFETHKDEFGLDEKPEIYKIEHFLKTNYEFARNEVTQQIEFRIKGDAEYSELNEDSIYRRIQQARFKFSLDKLRSLLKSDFVACYNPFVDYFNKLDAWDGVTDHISALANYIKTDDQQYYVDMFKKMLVRSIGCSLYKKENRYVFVFVQQDQNKGKSWFIRFLNPFGDKYYTERGLSHDKDTNFSFSENFIYNLEELQSLNNYDIQKLKAVISTASVKERKAYERNAKEQPRRCNFWGSTNKQEFLTDEQNSRWLCFTVKEITWGYRDAIDIHKVWAQAYALYHSSYDAQLGVDEANRRDKVNQSHEIVDIEKDLIMRMFAPATTKHKDNFMTISMVVERLNEHWSGAKLDTRFIGRIMSQLKFASDIKFINGRTVRGYYVRPGEFTFEGNPPGEQKPLF